MKLSIVIPVYNEAATIENLLKIVKGVDLGALESGFVKAAKGYSTRKGISYAAWREAGVDPAVLKQAGISRNVTRKH
jgi:hypothetical protein